MSMNEDSQDLDQTVKWTQISPKSIYLMMIIQLNMGIKNKNCCIEFWHINFDTKKSSFFI